MGGADINTKLKNRKKKQGGSAKAKMSRFTFNVYSTFFIFAEKFTVDSFLTSPNLAVFRFLCFCLPLRRLTPSQHK